MRDHENAVIGVVQLINKKRDRDAVLRPVALVEEEVIPFTSVDEELVELARQPGRGRLRERQAARSDIRDAVRRVRARRGRRRSSSATPPPRATRSAWPILTVGLAEKVDAAPTGPARRRLRFTREQVQEIRYAALLHDFGKVAVQEKYLRKGKKLYASAADRASASASPTSSRPIEADYLRARLEALESGAATPDAARRDRRATTTAPAQEIERVLADGARRPTSRRSWRRRRFRALMDLPARRFADATEAARTSFPVEDWAERPLPERRRGRGALDPQGKPLRRGARRDREPRHPHLRVPAEDPVDGRVRQHPRDRLRPPREARRDRLPARAQGRRDPASSRG